jgi:isocitrate lyase
MIEAGACAISENQVSDAKQCRHQESVTEDFIDKTNAT